MVVHVDVETNGFSRTNSSLLAVYAEKENGDVYERFYFPEEEYNEDAIAVNGLTEEVITKKRGDSEYPLYYKDDHEDLIEFLDDCHTFVAFNVNFDFKWMPEAFQIREISTFCTMKNCKEQVRALNKKGGLKNPKLSEAAEYFAIKIASEEENFHDASYDTKVSKAIFEIITGVE